MVCLFYSPDVGGLPFRFLATYVVGKTGLVVVPVPFFE